LHAVFLSRRKSARFAKDKLIEEFYHAFWIARRCFVRASVQSSYQPQ
jgi:hypothetical protein